MVSPKHPFKKAALITGGANRIGRALALYLSGLGYGIGLHCHGSRQAAEKTVQCIHRQGGEVAVFPANLLDKKAAERLILDAARIFPGLCVLVNNASVYEPSSWGREAVKSLDRDMAIHVTAPFVLINTFAKVCKKGNVINLLDTHIVKNTAGHLTYLLSKKTLAQLTQLAAVGLGPNIRVNGIAPGLILPPKGKDDNFLDRLARKIPLKKRGDVAFIKQAVGFLLENDYITGQIIFVDGGAHLV